MRLTPFFLGVAALFITLLVASNITAVKLVEVAGRVLPAAIVVFPVTYILGDVITEVYGFKRARQVIWLGFLCNGVAVLVFWIAQVLPPAPDFEAQDAYDRILGTTPRILLASFAGYLVGALSNSVIMSRMKIATSGRWLWSRTIGSTVVGEGLDSALFITIAFSGMIPGSILLEIVLTQWVVKVAYEVVATPFTYGAVAFLKCKEGRDHYDARADLKPSALFSQKS